MQLDLISHRARERGDNIRLTVAKGESPTTTPLFYAIIMWSIFFSTKVIVLKV